jgi:hypothetical protein
VWVSVEPFRLVLVRHSAQRLCASLARSVHAPHTATDAARRVQIFQAERERVREIEKQDQRSIRVSAETAPAREFPIFTPYYRILAGNERAELRTLESYVALELFPGEKCVAARSNSAMVDLRQPADADCMLAPITSKQSPEQANLVTLASDCRCAYLNSEVFIYFILKNIYHCTYTITICELLLIHVEDFLAFLGPRAGCGYRSHI